MLYAHPLFALFLVLPLLFQCGPPERDNPFDSNASRSQRRSGKATLALSLPLPKPLLSVVGRVVATLEAPDMDPIVKELEISPLGPASGTIGALPPGSGRTLTVRGYNLAGELIFAGQQRDITVAAGDTARISIELVPQGPLLEAPGGQTQEDSTGENSGAPPPAPAGAADEGPSS